MPFKSSRNQPRANDFEDRWHSEVTTEVDKIIKGLLQNPLPNKHAVGICKGLKKTKKNKQHTEKNAVKKKLGQQYHDYAEKTGANSLYFQAVETPTKLYDISKARLKNNDQLNEYCIVKNTAAQLMSSWLKDTNGGFEPSNGSANMNTESNSSNPATNSNQNTIGESSILDRITAPRKLSYDQSSSSSDVYAAIKCKTAQILESFDKASNDLVITPSTEQDIPDITLPDQVFLGRFYTVKRRVANLMDSWTYDPDCNVYTVEGNTDNKGDLDGRQYPDDKINSGNEVNSYNRTDPTHTMSSDERSQSIREYSSGIQRPENEQHISGGMVFDNRRAEGAKPLDGVDNENGSTRVHKLYIEGPEDTSRIDDGVLDLMPINPPAQQLSIMSDQQDNILGEEQEDLLSTQEIVDTILMNSILAYSDTDQASSERPSTILSEIATVASDQPNDFNLEQPNPEIQNQVEPQIARMADSAGFVPPQDAEPQMENQPNFYQNHISERALVPAHPPFISERALVPAHPPFISEPGIKLDKKQVAQQETKPQTKSQPVVRPAQVSERALAVIHPQTPSEPVVVVDHHLNQTVHDLPVIEEVQQQDETLTEPKPSPLSDAHPFMPSDLSIYTNTPPDHKTLGLTHKEMQEDDEQKQQRTPQPENYLVSEENSDGDLNQQSAPAQKPVEDSAPNHSETPLVQSTENSEAVNVSTNPPESSAYQNIDNPNSSQPDPDAHVYSVLNPATSKSMDNDENVTPAKLNEEIDESTTENQHSGLVNQDTQQVENMTGLRVLDIDPSIYPETDLSSNQNHSVNESGVDTNQVVVSESVGSEAAFTSESAPQPEPVVASESTAPELLAADPAASEPIEPLDSTKPQPAAPDSETPEPIVSVPSEPVAAESVAPDSPETELTALESAAMSSTALEPAALESVAPEPVAPSESAAFTASAAMEPAASSEGSDQVAPESADSKSTPSEAVALESAAPELEAPEPEAPESEVPGSAAPETAAPESATPQSATPESEAPESEAPEPAAPESAAAELEAPESAAAELEAPESAAASEPEAPESAVPESAAPESAAPEPEAPESEAPESAPPESAAPEPEAPESAAASEPEAPESAAPESTAPESAAPESAAPESAAPEPEAPESAAPESAALESAAPEPEAPESAAPESAALESAAPEPEAPESAAPDSAGPESAAPEPEAPESAAPDSAAPESAAPESEAVEPEAPESAAPESAAPESEAPEPEAPESAAPEPTMPESAAPDSEAPEPEAPESATPESAARALATPETEAPELAVPQSATPESATPESVAIGSKPPEAVEAAATDLNPSEGQADASFHEVEKSRASELTSEDETFESMDSYKSEKGGENEIAPLPSDV